MDRHCPSTNINYADQNHLEVIETLSGPPPASESIIGIKILEDNSSRTLRGTYNALYVVRKEKCLIYLNNFCQFRGILRYNIPKRKQRTGKLYVDLIL